MSSQGYYPSGDRRPTAFDILMEEHIIRKNAGLPSQDPRELPTQREIDAARKAELRDNVDTIQNDQEDQEDESS